ncbi:MAG: hypothetical protein ACI8W3_003687, partial [Myxococcota bacterium]
MIPDSASVTLHAGQYAAMHRQTPAGPRSTQRKKKHANPRYEGEFVGRKNPLHTQLCDQLGIEYPIISFTHCKDVAA